MKKNHKKVSLKKLLNRDYSPAVELEMINYFLKTAKNYELRTGWYVDGLDKFLFGYSANNHCSGISFNINSRKEFKDFIEILLFRAVIKGEYKWLQDWRKDFDINIDSFVNIDLKFNHKDKDDYRQHQIYDQLKAIINPAKRYLKKEYCHPDYENRVKPYIREHSMKFHNGWNGYIITFDFTFDVPGYEGSGWGESFCQGENESLIDFLDRAEERINAMLLPENEMELLDSENKEKL